MQKYLLDTNTCVITIKNKPDCVRERFNLKNSRLCISSITLMELIHGVETSSVPEQNLTVLEGFIARVNVLNFDTSAAMHGAQIKAELNREGINLAPFDMMIAGHARSQGLIIVTNNIREFGYIKGLRIENWFQNEDVKR